MASRAYVNATLHPMVPAHDDVVAAQEDSASWLTTHRAMLVQAGRVHLVGSESAIMAEARRIGAQVEDLDGRVVVPGFVDAHTHFLHIGVKRMRPALGGAPSREAALDRLVEWLKANPGATAVIAEGWDESGWPDRKRIEKGDLDDAARRAGQPGVPIVARRVCGHIATANSAALPPLQRRWPQPDIVHPETGILLEQASLYLNEVFPTPEPLLDRALQEASRAVLDLGITTVGDYSQAPYRDALRRAAKDARLPVRVASSIYVQQFDAERETGFRTGRPHGDFLRDGGLKVFLDGSLGAHSAALREPYQDASAALLEETPADAHPGHDATSRHGCVGHPHPRGTLNWSDADVRRHFFAAQAAGIQLHAHAIGDAAVDQGLEAFAELASNADLEGNGWMHNRMRHRFEHFEIVHDGQASAAAQLRIVSSSQPNFVGAWSAKAGMYEDRLGTRYRLNNRFATWKRFGIPLAFGSDGMPPGPLAGLRAAAAHPEVGERLMPAEAIWHYTYAAAWSLHWEDEVGSLAPGKWADFVVLSSRDLSRGLEHTRVEATHVGGKRAFPR